MNDDDFLRQLREAFAVEAAEHLQAMTNGLLELEQAPDPARRKDIVEVVFRDAHSLKGAARAVSHSEVETVCQALEGIFAQWKKTNEVPASPALFDLINRAIDLLNQLLQQAGSGTDPVLRSVAGGIAQELNTALANPQRLTAPTAAPPPAEPAVSATAPTPVPVAPPAAAPPAPPPEPAPPVPPPVPPPAVEIPHPHEMEMPQTAETVRIPMAKLDVLLRRAEELIAVKLGAHRNATELQAMLVELEAWHKEWLRIREFTRGDLSRQTPATLAQVADFFEYNQQALHATGRTLTALIAGAEHDQRSATTLINDLLDETKRLLMLPFATLLDQLPKVVRDVSRSRGKEVTLQLHGREVEIDKRILQEMKDPLIHLVRNSIDHGLEVPETRLTANKPRNGSLTISVSPLEGSKVEILVRDDGAGIDLEKVKSSAIRAGTLTSDAAAAMDEETALGLIFASGVSTSQVITEISGRGIGMAIVQDKVEKLGGHIMIDTTRGVGTSFHILLPVTLATLKGILVSVCGQTFIIPTAKVERTTRVHRDEIRSIEHRATIVLDGQAVALAHLHEVLELEESPATAPILELVVLGSGDRRIAFAVDAVLSEQEILVKNIGKPLRRVRNVAGATLLGTGIPAIILNTNDLLKTAIHGTGASLRSTQGAAQGGHDRQRHLLVVDDSVTSRILLKNILESAGYLITTAIDGVEAITALKAGTYDLLVSDVEMPRMNGFELTAKVRSDPKLSSLPVVLVTALESREDQERGIDVGANAYMVKSSFDQSNLLDIIARLL